MGTVYAAEQSEPIRRRVAVKLIKLGMDTREVIARFSAERQTLALMSHPNIAQVFEAGAGSHGEPYFVMELVEGVPLTRYCDELSLSSSRRLEIFALICDAIQHAHTKGIIHRDIKPGNVLVTQINGVSVPKVIDFGIARAVDRPASERTLFPNNGHISGTPEYMSPEQSDDSNTDIDARTDIYSLGAMLYELLCGLPPFDFSALRSRGHSEIQRIIRDVEPARPSARLSKLPSATASLLAEKRKESATGLTNSLRRELEWIPLKAMRKDREHRYRTASELADDVRNYLTAMPLLAGPQSRVYLGKKFLRRHRGGVAATAMVFTVVLIGIGVSSWQTARATRAEAAALAEKKNADAERTLAQQRFEDVRSLSNQMLTELLPQIDKLAGATPAIQKLVDMSLTYLAGLDADRSGNVSLMLDVARAYILVGDVQGNPYKKNIGDTASALKSYERSLQLEQKILFIDSGSASAMSEMGTSELKIGDVLSVEGKREQSVEHFERAKVFFAKVTKLRPDAVTSFSNPIVAEHRLALARLTMGDLHGATKSLTANVAASNRMVAAFPSSNIAKDVLLEELHGLAIVQTQAGSWQDAKSTLQDEIRTRESVLESDTTDELHQRELATALLLLANVEMTRFGDYVSAQQPLSKAVELYQHGFDADPTDVSALVALARGLDAEKDLFLHSQNFDAAHRSVQQEIDLLEKGLRFSPGSAVIGQNLGVAFGSLADVYQRQNNLPAALEMRKRAVSQIASLASADPGNKALLSGLGFFRRQSADSMTLTGDIVGAVKEARAAVEIFTHLHQLNRDNAIYSENLQLARQSFRSVLAKAVRDLSFPSEDRERCLKELDALDGGSSGNGSGGPH